MFAQTVRLRSSSSAAAAAVGHGWKIWCRRWWGPLRLQGRGVLQAARQRLLPPAGLFLSNSYISPLIYLTIRPPTLSFALSIVIDNVIRHGLYSNLASRHTLASRRSGYRQQPHFQSLANQLTPFATVASPANGVCAHFLRRGLIKPNKTQMTCAVWSGDNRWLVLGTADGDFALWEADSLKVHRLHRKESSYLITILEQFKIIFIFCNDLCLILKIFLRMMNLTSYTEIWQWTN